MKLRALTALLLLVALASSAWAAQGDPEQVYAIQERRFARFHELALPVGFITDDDFYYAYPVGLSYTFHFNENLAWEVLRGQWVFNDEKDLRADLESDFGVTPEHFDKIQYTLHSNFVLKPSYGKDALWNRWIVNHETFVLAGAGVTGYEREFSDGETQTETALSLSFGLGRKYFLNETFCLNLEVRDLVNFKDSGVENNVYLGVSLGFRFNLAPRAADRTGEVEEFRRRLTGAKDE
ncbi:MAG: outer membrane beta-barrel domain-containing protein [Proteobacteria bacterium]|nr:outer membrane beta-barrel domain-containing protein [Pseudomonadota bacterium]